MRLSYPDLAVTALSDCSPRKANPLELVELPAAERNAVLAHMLRVTALEREKAQKCYGRRLYEWSAADPGLKWMKNAGALGLNGVPAGETITNERPYRPEQLAGTGPIKWEPYAAPELSCVDINGAQASMKDFRGSNILLVFYLGDECVRCVEQLKAINARAGDWASENTVVLGVSSASPEKNRAPAKIGNLAMRCSPIMITRMRGGFLSRLNPS